jgi:uncharacterized protein YigA (DUF484 family)
MTEQPRSEPDTPLTELQVAGFLRQNPDFFALHPDLLADLTLPHDSGSAISLVERQVAILRERNMDMRHRLSKLLDNARDNDRLFDKTKRLVLSLLESRDLIDKVNALYYSFNHDFGIHFTSLILFGDEQRLNAGPARVVRFSEAREPLGNLLKSHSARCGSYTVAEVNFLFAKHAPEVGSAATVPLFSGSLFGILAIGNRDANFYRSSMGTLFLSYIGEILTRTLPAHMED